MKKLVKFQVLSFLVVILSLGIMETNAYSATAKTKSVTTMTEAEQKLESLKYYRDVLKGMGASVSEIEAADKAVAFQEAAVALEQYYKALEKQTKAAEKPSKKASKNKKETVVLPPEIGTVFVGDSRMVQMHEAMGETGVTYVAENAKGYDWFVAEAIPRINNLAVKGSKILINLGVNDPGNIDKYIETVNFNAPIWQANGAKVYYATVNPVSENPYTSAEQVDEFNRQLVNGLKGVTILDSNYYIRQNGYNILDGLHYDAPTYAKLYAYYLSNVIQ